MLSTNASMDTPMMSTKLIWLMEGTWLASIPLKATIMMRPPQTMTVPVLASARPIASVWLYPSFSYSMPLDIRKIL